MVVKKGDKIKVEYEGTLDDGTVFDSSTHGDHSHPIEFEVGSGQVIPGFDKAVIGLKKGEEKTIKLKPSEAYGQPKPEMIKKLPKDKLPPEVKKGMMLGMQIPNGPTIPARVTEVGDKEVTLDLNHPLAGKVLNFKLKVIEITSPPK